MSFPLKYRFKIAVITEASPSPLIKNVPVEPFGGEEDFDVNGEYLVYTTKDPLVNEATHTRQNVSLDIVDTIRHGQPINTCLVTSGLSHFT